MTSVKAPPVIARNEVPRQSTPIVKDLGLRPYEPTWRAMQEFTNQRKLQVQPAIPDQLWLVEHEPVFTLGQAGKLEHLLQATNIPVVHTDRGGQITYHGPGQLTCYLLLDLKARNLGVKQLVCNIEAAVIALLQSYDIDAHRIAGAPGIYVSNAKICALGLRVKHGCTYHGLSLNVDMDLQPFSYINPCGYKDMQVTQLRDCIKHSKPAHQEYSISIDTVATQLIKFLQQKLDFT
jgi:lipoyl(octanoyl) transferase